MENTGKNINKFAKEVAQKLNEVNHKASNLIDDSTVSTEKAYSSSKLIAYLNEWGISDYAKRLRIKTPNI